MLPIFLQGQTCEGNKGINIFSEGNFGAGSENAVSIDSEIAPGYTYSSTELPPPDGNYVITNNTNPWAATYDWIFTGDNSSDPNGYMMVVNATFDPGLFYEQPIPDACEGAIYEFSADFINLNRINVPNTISPNIEFVIDGNVVLETGDIPKDESWHTYNSTFVSEPGQTSFMLSLRNKAPGGFGNDVGIDNITFAPCGPLAGVLPNNEQFCIGTNLVLEAAISNSPYEQNFIQWQLSLDDGATWENTGDGSLNNTTLNISTNENGIYRYLIAGSLDNLMNANCRVVSDIKTIVVSEPSIETVQELICEGEEYQLIDGTMVSQTGTYEASFDFPEGCENMIITELTVEASDECGNCSLTPMAEFVDCYDCMNVPFGTARVDSCGFCLSTDNPDFARECLNIISPTAFSPNGDGLNDQLNIRLVNVDTYKMQIFDRWGKRVFTTTNESTPWDGTVKGNKAPVGVYVMAIEYREVGKSETKVFGENITLIR